MLVLAFLTITAAGQPAPDADSGPIDLTRNETAHLLATCDDLDR
jgi:hypothetical protein